MGRSSLFGVALFIVIGGIVVLVISLGKAADMGDAQLGKSRHELTTITPAEPECFPGGVVHPYQKCKQ